MRRQFPVSFSETIAFRGMIRLLKMISTSENKYREITKKEIRK